MPYGCLSVAKQGAARDYPILDAASRSCLQKLPLVVNCRVSLPWRPPQSDKDSLNRKGALPKMNIFVGNLSFQTTQDELHAAFAQFGNVERVNIVTDRDTGQPRGFAFVEMTEQRDA